MGIKNPDGSCYMVAGTRQQFDPENPDMDLFNDWDQEAIEIGGSPVYYYEVFIQPQTIDPIYWEDRGKLWSNDPIQLWCYYEPIPSSNQMTNYGMDGFDEMVFEFNAKAVLQTVGHPPKIGSRIFSPHKREHWEIIQRNYGEWKMWGEFRLQLICKRFQDSSVHGERATQAQPDFKLNEGKLLG